MGQPGVADHSSDGDEDGERRQHHEKPADDRAAEPHDRAPGAGAARRTPASWYAGSGGADCAAAGSASGSRTPTLVPRPSPDRRAMSPPGPSTIGWLMASPRTGPAIA